MPASTNPAACTPSDSKSSELMRSLEGAKSVLILTHDYPDPDCIASAFGLSHLFAYWKTPSSVISFGGFVGRAENRAMVRYLNITMVPFVLIDVKEFDKIVLVDTFPGKGNVSLPPLIPVDAVIDHHPPPAGQSPSFFCDIKEGYGATSTLVTRYLLECGCPIPSPLATALFYGIKTDTGAMKRDVSREDLDCYTYLFDHIDHRQLALIENPDRETEYFRLLYKACGSVVNFNDIGYVHLGDVSTPDYIAEIADLFHRLEQIEWMIASGFFKNQIFFSIRAKNHHSAGIKAENCAKALGGTGGGHGRAAAGRVPISSDDTANNTLELFELQLREIFKVTSDEAQKLIQEE